MSFNAAALKLMADKGLSAHDIAEIAAVNEMRSSAAERQARYRERKRNERDVTRDVTPSPNERDNLTPTRETKTEPKGSSKSLIEEEKQRAIGSCLKVAYPAPDGVTDPVWRDFLNSPKRRKAGMSATAYSGIVRNLAELAEHGFPPGEMIVLAVERGWVTVKLEWVLNDNDRRTHTMGRHQPADGLSATTRAAVKVFGPG